MKSLKKLLCFLPLIALTSCGYAKDYIVEGNKYNSPNFSENYYREFDVSLKDAKQGLDVNVENDYFITNIADLGKVDYDYIDVEPDEIDTDEYGEKHKMNKIDNLFNYGVQSKLFDGQMICGGQNGHPERAYQLARVQIDSNGFAIRFSKESSELHYFALQFKATTDNTVAAYKVNSGEPAKSDRDMFHNSTVTLHTHLYTKDGDEVVKNTFTSTIDFDNKLTNDGWGYKFYAFSFDALDISLSRVIGFGVTYEYEDDLINWNKTKGVDIDYSLMLYEMFLPGTTWK